MNDSDKSKSELIAELQRQRECCAELEGLLGDYESIKRSLAEHEQRCCDLMEHTSDVIYTADLDGVITSVNKAAKSVFDADPEEMVGESFAKWIPEEKLAEVQGFQEKVLRGESVTEEVSVVDRHGATRIVELTAIPLYKDGKLVGLSLIHI